MGQYEVLHSKFDIETHKKTFTCYLEIIILEDGTIEYAVPSHQLKLMDLMMEKYGISRDEVLKRCPEEYYFDFDKWLCKELNCIEVWTDFIKGECNEKQINTLKILKQEGLYCGDMVY